jgi:hypothetical protein
MVKHAAPNNASQMIQPAYNFVLAEQTRVAAEGNQELIERYAFLRSYFEMRLPLWGLQAQKRTYKRARRRFRNSCAL